MKNKYVSLWLFGLCGCLVLMVILGGLTRLTDSGLSIVKWEPLSGALPPSATRWNYYFGEYQKTSQYRQMNRGMTLEEFKGIFWLEYFHRLMGRVTGVVFAVPFVCFLWRREITRGMIWKFGGIFLIGALQGVIGWYMVKSGFVGRTSVSQYMLAFHLGMAFLIYGLLYWCALDSVIPAKAGIQNVSALHKPWIPAFAGMTLGMVFIMVLLGAFMAGTHAGYTYNTWPKMDGHLVPDGLYVMQPWWRNHFENVAMVQFQHRWFAMVTAGVIFVFSWRLVRIGEWRLAVWLSGVVVLQIILGISALYALGHYSDYEATTYAYRKIFYLPVIIAALHQLNALILYAVALTVCYKFTRKRLDIIV